MRVPGADLRAQHRALRAELMQTFGRVLDSAAFIQGPEVEAFEREFAAYCGVRHAVGVANGTDALALALRALGIGREHVVVVPAFTFAATAEAVCHTGARPLPVDIDPQTFTLDPECLRRALRGDHGRVRAVIPVHLYGQPAAMDDIAAVAAEHNVAIVEDAAQAHGARYRGRRVGGIGPAGCFSFYPTKNLGALGDAGAVTTNDDALAGRIVSLRDHGQAQKYVHDVVGFNSRLDAVQAAALRVKLPHLDEWNARRQALAALYRARLSGAPGIELPAAVADRTHVYHLFVVRCRARGALQAHLQERGIASSVHYPFPLHRQAAFAHVCADAGELPVAEAAAREVLALPLYPELTDETVVEISETIAAWAEGRR